MLHMEVALGLGLGLIGEQPHGQAIDADDDWSWRSRTRPRTGRRAIPQQLQVLIRRMAVENRLWGQKRIQAEVARLGFKVSARTVAKYMRTARHDRGPSVRWRTFLKLHASNIWACDFFCVQTLLLETLHVFTGPHCGTLERSPALA